MSADVPTGVAVPADGDDPTDDSLARHHHDSPELGPAVEAREVQAEELSLDAIDAVTMSGLALVDDVVDDDDLVEDPGDELDDEVDDPDDDATDEVANNAASNDGDARVDVDVDEGGGSP